MVSSESDSYGVNAYKNGRNQGTKAVEQVNRIQVLSFEFKGSQKVINELEPNDKRKSDAHYKALRASAFLSFRSLLNLIVLNVIHLDQSVARDFRLTHFI